MSLNPFLQGIDAGTALGTQVRDTKYNRMLAPLVEQQDFAGAARLASQQGRTPDVMAFQAAGDQFAQQRQASERQQVESEWTAAKQRSEALLNVVTAAERVPEEQRGQWVQQVLPMLAQQGVQIDLGMIRPEMLTTQGLQGLRAQLQAVTGQLDQVGGEYGFANVGGTLVRTDTRRGEAVPVFTAPQQPDVPSGFRLRADGQGLEYIPGGPQDPDVLAQQARVRGSSAPSVNVYTGQVTPSNQTAAQSALIEQSGLLERLNGIQSAFESGASEYLGLGGQIATAGRAAMDFVAPGLMGETDRAKLREAAAFRSQIMTNFNQTLRDMSGAAVTQNEFERIRGQMPAPNDGPTVFAAKMQASIDLAQAAIRRQQYFLQNGIPFNDAIAAQMPLEQFLSARPLQGPALGAPTGQGASTPVSPGAERRYNPRTGTLE